MIRQATIVTTNKPDMSAIIRIREVDILRGQDVCLVGMAGALGILADNIRLWLVSQLFHQVLQQFHLLFPQGLHENLDNSLVKDNRP